MAELSGVMDPYEILFQCLRSDFILNLDEHWVLGFGFKPGRVRSPVIHGARELLPNAIYLSSPPIHVA